MDPLTVAKLWVAVKPFKRMKQARLRRKARSEGHEIVPVITDAEAEVELKEAIKRKSKGAVRSSTVGVGALILAVGLWVQQNPDTLALVLPDGYQGHVMAVVGLVVILARLRTAGQ